MRIACSTLARSLLALILLSAGCDGDGDPAPAVAALKPVPPAPPAESEFYPNFGNGGVVLSDLSVGTGQPDAVIHLGSSIYVGGSFRAFSSGETMGRWKIEKRDAATGDLQRFSTGTGPFGTITAMAVDADALYAAGIEHVAFTPEGTVDSAWRVEKRRLRTGAVVRGFGNEGVLTLDLSPGPDLCRGILVAGDDLFLIGEDASFQVPTGPVNLQWRIEKRSATTGALDPTFGNGGVAIFYNGPGPAGAFSAEPRDLLVLGNSLFVAGTESGRWRIEKRDRTTGALDPAFGTGGVVTRDPGFNLDEARRISTDGTFLYVAGTEEYVDGRAWRIEKFSAQDGATVAAFGVDGVLHPLPKSYNTEPHAMVQIGGALYIGGAHADSEQFLDLRWALIKLQTSDGILVSSFGTNGVLDTNPSARVDHINGLATDGTALFIAGAQDDFTWRIEKRAR